MNETCLTTPLSVVLHRERERERERERGERERRERGER